MKNLNFKIITFNKIKIIIKLNEIKILKNFLHLKIINKNNFILVLNNRRINSLIFLIKIIYNKIKINLKQLITPIFTNKKNNLIINKKIKIFHNLLMILNINL